MAETFNPYAEWLGLRSAGGRPNHYELLRLKPFESDSDAILTAANLQMAKVRGVRPAGHFDDWQRILDELSAAKRCLCDFGEKSQYDSALRAQGWPGPSVNSGVQSSERQNESAAAAKPAPYMVVTDAAVSNPMPPGFGANKTAAATPPAASPSAASKAAGGNATGGSSSSAAPWQPGMNLLPPRPRVNPAAPSAPSTSAPATAPSAPPAPPTTAVPPVAPKPKLQFPGETVPTTPAPTPPAPAPPPAFPSPGPAMPTGMPPAGMPQPGGAFNQFPRPFPPIPMPGMAPPGAAPQQMPQPPMPQQPFGGQFFPGGPMPPAMNPQLPFQFPRPPAATGQFAPMPFAPPGAMPGYPPHQGAMPGFAGNYPPQAMPPAMPQQPMMPQPSQGAAPAAGGNFLDDVLSGPSRGDSSALDELGFGDAPQAPQAVGQWPSGNPAQPMAAPAAPVGFEQAPQQSFEQAEYDPSGETTSRPRPSARPQQGSRMMLIGGALGAVALLAAVLVTVMIMKQKEPAVAVADPTDNGSTEPTVPHPAVTHPKPPLPHPKPPEPAKNPSNTAPTPEPPKAKTPSGVTPPPANLNNKPTPLVMQPTGPDPSKPKPPKPPAVDPAKAARLAHLMVDIRQKLAERDQDGANRLIADATPLAVTPEQTDRVQRMAALVRYVGEFWGAVRDAMKALKATDEIEIGSDKAIVVDRDDQSLTIRMAGGNHHFTLHEMPGGLAVALADRWLDPNKPENKIFIGSFYAVNPKSDPDDAKRLWTEASAAGVADGAFLLPLLNPEPAVADMPAGQSDSLAPVPDRKDVDRITVKVKEEFDDAIVKATTPTKLAELIQKLFDAADASDDPVRQYVLYVEARDTAAKAGRAKLAIDAIDRIAKEFRVDALDMKADTFSNYPPTTAAGGREVARSALTLVDEAIGAKRVALASRLAQVAVIAAQVSKQNDLVKRAMQRSKEVEALGGKKMASDPQ